MRSDRRRAVREKRLPHCWLCLVAVWPALSASSQQDLQWLQATSQTAWSPRSGHAAVVHNGRMWVLGGRAVDRDGYYYANDVWCSSDGVHWTSATLSAPWRGRFGHASVAHDGRIWVLGGMYSDYTAQYLNDVWYSSDGVRWTSATLRAQWAPRAYHSSLVHDGKLWVMGGSTLYGSYPWAYIDAWSSVDGVNWTCATSSAAWGIRPSLASVAFDGKIWVIGGCHPDVWYSSNGVQWTSATLSAPWGRRFDHGSVVYDGRMWLIGGDVVDTTVTLGDVWYSTDGGTWRVATPSAPWGPRKFPASVVYDGKIWILGGTRLIEVWRELNDVWYSWTPARATNWQLYP